MDQHFVYFIKAKRYPWLKVGKSATLSTLEKRLATIQAREPFEIVVKGVSSIVTEEHAHTALAEHRIRSEWFRWNQTVSDWVKAQSDVYTPSKDGDDGLFILFTEHDIAQQNARNLEICRAMSAMDAISPPPS